jgi:hypothetical protein
MPEFHDDLTPELKKEASKLSPVGQRLLEMWNFHRPDLVELMRQDGTLHPTLVEKSQRSQEMADSLINQGWSEAQAWEFVKSEWPLPDPPDEQDESPEEEKPLDW